MPRKHKTPNTPRDRLARLSILPDLVLEGAARPLNIPIEDGDGGQPWTVNWVDATTGFVRASGVIEVGDDGVLPEDEVNGLFAEACTGPFLPTDAGTLALIDEMSVRGGRGPALHDEAPPAGLPGRVRVEAGALVALVRALAEPLGVRVEEAAPGTLSPRFEQAYSSLAGYLERQFGGGPREPFAWDIPREALAPLMKAAGGLWRRAPWTYLPDHPPLAVRLGEHGPEPGVELVYASILGGGGMVEGVALYYSPDDFRNALRQGGRAEAADQDVDQMVDLLRQSGAPVAGVPDELLRGVVGDLLMQSGVSGVENAESMTPQQNSLALLFGPAEDEDQTYLDWLKERGLKAASREGVPSFYRTEAGEPPRQPNARETRALALAVEALNQYFSKHANSLRGPLLSTDPLLFAARVEGVGEPAVVTVTFPPRDWDFDADEEALGDAEDEDDEGDEPLQPASLEGMRTVYRFKIAFQGAPDLWRRIEVRGDQTLDDLHDAIQEAFGWDNDHLYAFYLSGKAGDIDTEYMHPDGEGRSAASYRLEHLPLHARQHLLYLFDFGDELRHTVTLEAITPSGVTPGTTYPRITEAHGENVPQYPDMEDEEEWDEGEEGDEEESDDDGDDE